MSRRVVVVTGASAGIGRACSRAFAERGDYVALLARGDAGLEGAADDVRRAGARALPIAVDVAHHLGRGDHVARGAGQAGPQCRNCVLFWESPEALVAGNAVGHPQAVDCQLSLLVVFLEVLHDLFCGWLPARAGP